MSDIIYISNARLSFPHLIEPQVRQNADGSSKSSYNCELLLASNDPGYAAFMQRYQQLATEQWKENTQAAMQMIHGDRKARCYGQGEEKVNKKTFKPYDGYASQVYITVGSKDRPQLIDINGKAIDRANTMLYTELARKLYGGCRVNVAIKPWLQKPNPEKQYSAGIRCDLIAIQFAADDQPFGEAAPDASNMFSQVAGTPASTIAQTGGMPLPPFMTGQ